MEKEVHSPSERMVILEELLTCLRGNEVKLAERKVIRPSQVYEEQEKHFRWYEQSNRGLSFLSIPLSIIQ